MSIPRARAQLRWFKGRLSLAEIDALPTGEERASALVGYIAESRKARMRQQVAEAKSEPPPTFRQIAGMSSRADRLRALLWLYEELEQAAAQPALPDTDRARRKRERVRREIAERMRGLGAELAAAEEQERRTTDG